MGPNDMGPTNDQDTQQQPTSTSAAAETPTVAAPVAGSHSDGAEGATSSADVAPAPHENPGQKILHAVLGALGGTDEVTYRRASTDDVKAGAAKQEGELIATRAKIGPGQQWKRIIAGALTGAAAGAAQHGPGHLGRSAALGFQAGSDLSTNADAQKRKQADQDFDATQTATVRKAQTALLNQQVSELAFKNARSKVTAGFEDATRENQFAAAITSGGLGSQDLGVARNLDDLVKMHQDMPGILQQQAHGNVIGIPHVNEQGQIDGMHYALVTPEWKNAKLDHDETFYQMKPPSKIGDKPSIDKQTVKAGTMTNGDFWNARMSSEKDIMSHYEDQAKRETELEKTRMTEAGANQRAVEANKTKETVADIKGKSQAIRQHDRDYVKPANDVEKSYSMMQHAYDEYQAAKKAGKDLPTGAQSMVALSTHLQTTFGQVKGSRVTKDMIREHLGARSISDSAEVAINKLKNGDALSEDQWQAFHDLISESRRLSWETATKEAKRKDIPVDFLPQDLQSLAAPEGATDEVLQNGKVVGHIVAGKYVPLGTK